MVEGSEKTAEIVQVLLSGNHVHEFAQKILIVLAEQIARLKTQSQPAKELFYYRLAPEPPLPPQNNREGAAPSAGRRRDIRLLLELTVEMREKQIPTKLETHQCSPQQKLQGRPRFEESI